MWSLCSVVCSPTPILGGFKGILVILGKGVGVGVGVPWERIISCLVFEQQPHSTYGPNYFCLFSLLYLLDHQEYIYLLFSLVFSNRSYQFYHFENSRWGLGVPCKLWQVSWP